MKTINKLMVSLGVGAMACGFSSCVGDLDLTPTDPNTNTNVSQDMDAVFTDIYLSFSCDGANNSSPVEDFDGGMANFSRAMFTAECMPTDECAWLWDPDKFGDLKYGRVTTDVPCIYGWYSRLSINIALCNQFIQCVNDGTFKLDDAGRVRAQEYIRQARTLRGLCYYYLLSFYDDIPYADESTTIGSLPPQLPRAEVYANVTSDLESVVAEYGQNQVPAYGFVGLDAAESILAKIYLNSQVFAGVNDAAKCYAHCKNVIDRLGHGGKYGTGLAWYYHTLFGANNEKYVLGNAGSDVNEIIMASVNDREHLLAWGGATFMIDAWLGDKNYVVTVPRPTNKPELDGTLFTDDEGHQCIYGYTEAKGEEYDAEVDAWKKLKWEGYISQTINGVHYSFDPVGGACALSWYNAGDGWKCLVARKSFVEKFEWLNSAKSESNDTRTNLFLTSKQNFPIENKSILGDDWGTNGYLTPKYTNWVYNDNGTIDAEASALITTGSQVGGDQALIRLAEIYLTAAEAILNGGGGSQAEALDYVNRVRERAYGVNYTPWTSLSMESLQDERARELYNENVRRTDLIRWNLWTNGYTWDWKGGVRKGTNLPEYTKLYPIPEKVMISSNFRQTKGY